MSLRDLFLSEAERRARQQRAYDQAFAESRLATEVTSAIGYYLETTNRTYDDLETALGVPRGRLATLMTAPENMTLRTLARIAAALGARVDVQLVADKEED